MSNRVILGNLGGSYVIRASLPGHDVVSEAFNSSGISFDSRYSDIGTVIATGLITCDGAAVSFPSLPYVPPVIINRWDGSNCWSDDIQTNAHNVNGWLTWIPAVAIVNQSAIRVVSFVTPWYNTLSFFNPSGQPYVYSVFSLD